MRTVVLCGGKGTRAYPHTVEVPKPLLPVGGKPVLLHVLELYASQGFHDFVLAAGFKGELIAEFARTLPNEWLVDVVDTGEDAGTGTRLSRCRGLVGETFFATYADGLGDVDLGSLLRFHQHHPGMGTVTTVPLPSQYGTLVSDGEGRVSEFREKPVLRDHWINGGFFVFDRHAFDLRPGDDLERHVLPALGAAGELFAYRHHGFWKSMDTYKDALELTSLCADGDPPWIRSPVPASW